jgi:hypothetical protein
MAKPRFALKSLIRRITAPGAQPEANAPDPDVALLLLLLLDDVLRLLVTLHDSPKIRSYHGI